MDRSLGEEEAESRGISSFKGEQSGDDYIPPLEGTPDKEELLKPKKEAGKKEAKKEAKVEPEKKVILEKEAKVEPEKKVSLEKGLASTTFEPFSCASLEAISVTSISPRTKER